MDYELLLGNFKGSDVIEQAMLFALGFLVASLIALAAAPAFWRRAIRLSTRRLEMQLPLSAEEILASRDLLRAEFAIEKRQLEQKAKALNQVHAADMAELGRRAAIIDGQDDLVAPVFLARRGAPPEIFIVGS